VTVAITPAIRSPLVAGIVRPVILLPAAALEWPAAAVELIVLHELLHVRRYDNLVTLLQRAVEAALWFHPAVWSVSRWVDDEREHCCDDLVLSLTGRQEAYAETLIRLAGDGRARRAAFSTFGRDPVAVRLRRILFPRGADHVSSLGIGRPCAGRSGCIPLPGRAPSTGRRAFGRCSASARACPY
jgi:beta-lactamase regulating signal transducer with metallopeptidase domain